jgi:hypothetical protein
LAATEKVARACLTPARGYVQKETVQTRTWLSVKLPKKGLSISRPCNRNALGFPQVFTDIKDGLELVNKRPSHALGEFKINGSRFSMIQRNIGVESRFILHKVFSVKKT